MMLQEENGYYEIDCSNALWATDEHHDLYQKLTASMLTDADWIIETAKDGVLVVEYKNGTVFPSREPFNPNDREKIEKVAHKYYDTLHYLSIQGKKQPAKYYYILEYPNSDSVTNKMIREKIAKILPFNLQNSIENGTKIIESFDVVSIDEWNTIFPDLPISRTSKPFRVVR